MSCTERVVNINVCQRGQGLRKLWIIAFLVRMKSEIFEEQNVAARYRRRHSLNLWSNAVGSYLHPATQQSSKSFSHRLQTVLWVRFAFGPTEVRTNNRCRAGCKHVSDGRQSGNDAGVVTDLAFLQRHIQIRAYQDTFTGNLHVGNCLLVHAAFSGRCSFISEVSFIAIYETRPATRIE